MNYEFRSTHFRCRFNHTIEDFKPLVQFEVWRKWAMREAIQRSGGNVSAAARFMGVGKSTLQRWLRERT